MDLSWYDIKNPVLEKISIVGGDVFLAIKTTVNKNFNGDFSVVITHTINGGYETITPIVKDGVKWETDRKGSPGKLTFQVYNDKSGLLNFEEGDVVALKFRDDKKGEVIVFKGYIFTKKTTKDGWIDVTAYDQLRYFKNKADYVYTEKKASDVLRMIINDYNLNASTIDETNYVISGRVENDQCLFDIVQYAMDETLKSTKDLYVLYADSKGICLRNAENMKTDVVINNLTAKDFDYNTSIDEETYTEVTLYYDNDKTNKREYYNASDPENQKKWGILSHTESIQNTANAKDRATQMLQLYNRKTKKLQVKEAFGDYRCRAGASVIVQLDLGDTTISNYMLIEKATHTFKKDEYRMDLTLDGFKEESVSNNVVYNEANVEEEVVEEKVETNGYLLSIINIVEADLTPIRTYLGSISTSYYDVDGKWHSVWLDGDIYSNAKKFKEVTAKTGSTFHLRVTPDSGYKVEVSLISGQWTNQGIVQNQSVQPSIGPVENFFHPNGKLVNTDKTAYYTCVVDQPIICQIKWSKGEGING